MNFKLKSWNVFSWTAMRGQKKEIEELKKRVDDYDALKLSESLARIQTDLEWIKRKLEEE